MKFSEISRASNSYCKATCTAYLANVTDASVAILGLMPPMPPTRKYVFRRSKCDDRVRAVMLAAALISEVSELSFQAEKVHRRQPTAFTNDGLADIVTPCAMNGFK